MEDSRAASAFEEDDWATDISLFEPVYNSNLWINKW